MLKHINIKVHGQVQGVFFRVSAQDQAEKLGITGFVRNKPDGSIYIEAEGEQESLNEFIKWCHGGPKAAKVEKVEVTEGSMKNFKTFDRDFADY